ncbi:hypothetical protein [Chryseobacterium indoltheticum]|uniref:Protein kinase domain-containing protein n=1 Tax=Chryseobacterium indoltheticum TaxID=254 RepID=A0A381FAV0_9FLAO|nr:hypothetical protein [Chryseobacterium indoltheticum]AZA73592.1 hypothetical protein EG358_07400 [Chryseobacterium indoltheticum]SIR23461.1 hypothetical protein SAMN05421682_11561 [Chryseobacterium indoltheticum]SUX43573.1 Uncharacterised protein [Chryseobacterium indoltheticum]
MKDVLKSKMIDFGIKFNEINHMTNITFLDKGAESVIYEIDGTNLILKYSNNVDEFNAYKKLLEIREELLEGIFEIPILVDENDGKYYFIFQKIDNIDKDLKTLFRTIEYFLEEINVENMISLESKKVELIRYLNLRGFSNYEVFLQFLVQANRLLKKYNFSDVHNDNIMIDDEGKFKIIDIQYQ